MTSYTSLYQQGQTHEFDVLVIGAGLSGLHYCLQLVALRPQIKIALIDKSNINDCNSRYAQGGIAAAMANDDSTNHHIQDTLNAGDGLCYKPAVECIINQGPQAIQELEAYHIPFEKSEDQTYALAKEGGHDHRRILHCGDETGQTIINTILNQLHAKPQIQHFKHHTAVNLITRYTPHRNDIQGEVLGAYLLDTETDLIHTFLARAVVLATGGAGKTFRYTSNPMIATGDGVAMAYRAGARVGNMEFYQFHPTLLHHPILNNFLISEALRGEGATLKNAETHERFMAQSAPEHMELATRDVVARAIHTEIENSKHNFVYLDSTHLKKSYLKQRFPQIFTTLMSVGIDMSQDMIPVVPGAHYQCGGIVTDVDGRTDLNRLFAIGEVAFTGLHGANRLASNSLLEAVVMASNAVHASLKNIASPIKENFNVESWGSPGVINTRRASQINAHWRSLRGEMTSYAGIIRTEEGLSDLLQLIQKRAKIVEEYYRKHWITRDFIELRNIILNAELMVRAALLRRESRGGHYREDFPLKNRDAQESILRANTLEGPFV